MPYTARVNKKDINMERLAKSLTEMEAGGWHLAAVFEQAGNTVQVFQTHSLLQQLLAEQRRTNQLLEWLGQRLGTEVAQ
jgi:hypothetical protein